MRRKEIGLRHGSGAHSLVDFSIGLAFAPGERGLSLMLDERAQQIAATIRQHPAIRDVSLVGSRLDGTASALSDWDFKIDTDEHERVFAELSVIVSAFQPLAAFWDPLGERRNYMAIFLGLLKLDLHLDMEPLPAHPWRVSADTLADLDRHFWDWSLWLAGKFLKGNKTLVTRELKKMSDYLLRPLGCMKVPADVAGAVAEFVSARQDAESNCGVRVAGNAFELEVRSALDRHGLT
jgi:predicted nucleotidyltransferase